MRGNTARLARGVSDPRCIPQAKGGFPAPLWNPPEPGPSVPTPRTKVSPVDLTKEPSRSLDPSTKEAFVPFGNQIRGPLP